MRKFQVEALVIDDSFINYCLGRDHSDVEDWQEVIRQQPDENAVFDEARDLVLGLTFALGADLQPAKPMLYPLTNTAPKRKITLYAAVIAGAILVTGIFMYKHRYADQPAEQQQCLAQVVSGQGMYNTANKERKTIVLRDGTRITMNAASSFSTSNAFGTANRDVFLDGEAVFDVAKNQSLPFIVHTPFYKIRVLGTVFNVKAYHQDGYSETSLIRGKVEIQLQDHKNLQLIPKTKLIFSIAEQHNQQQPGERADSVICVKPITEDNQEQLAKETGWTRGRLEINNETFGQMKGKLERWFDVQFAFTDQEVMDYAFTATFEKESIETVLQALQASYSFKFSIHGKTIKISK